MGSSVGSTTMVEAIRQAEEDESVKAIVVRVDSPGGSALASDLIWNELRKSKKPVIASMGDVAASGGYYISMGCQKIYAEPGTLTGSIGVVGGKLTFGGLYDMIGIRTEVIKRGQHSEIPSTDRPFSASERETFHNMMKDIYDQFVEKAAQGRQRAGKKMTRDDVDKLAGGRIWTGRQAKQNGLVDELGTLEDAIGDAWAKAKMPKDTEPEILVLPKSPSFLDSILEDFLGARAPSLDLRKVPIPREVRERMGSVEAMLKLRAEPVWLISPYTIKVR
jgi:protease-4